ncbi:sulfite reductase subunit alpha [Mycobacterium sp. MS1601]|uniref:diflavin oxidoreductase n=1 Tax=Mycobacterium sp. MS1601 TaxID=1936029 RepID=UPI00097936D9|nr:sulfite reductase flavoprotein subunit alpha [Mycobacterium sp. MS1601]AQA05974.1 sulfite reductase subunit alpha [Mycobacterium sp. MS1601]
MPDPFSLLVGYGSETGGAEQLAGQFAVAAKALGIDVTPVELNAVDAVKLAAATHFVAITATYGEGEFPYNAHLFWDLLEGFDASSAPKPFEHLSFAVLGLGDKYYIDFANAGKLLDARLEELGATRLTARVDCDVDFDADAAAWTAGLIELLPCVDEPVSSAADPVDSPQWHRGNPFTAALVSRQLLTEADSQDEVWHYELDLAGSGLTYQSGDSIGVHPVNDPTLVKAVLTRLGRSADDTVPGHDQPLGTLLAEHFEIRTPSRDLQALVADRTADTEAAAALRSDDPATLESWLYDRDLLDLLDLAELRADEVLSTLRPLQHRDYSIASSPHIHPERVHLTVATVRHHRGGRARAGVASGYLADHAEQVRLHLVPNSGFRLPAPDVPIIMVGPGTGIAPFRAFLQERRATAATGKAWLFFGHRHHATDFLYRQDLQDFLETGVLSRLNLAFSRDGHDAKYVQHHMLTHAADLFAWLQEGAHLYVCGDASRMARDVHHTLHQIVASAGGLDADAARAYVDELTRAHRYCRDVY